MPRRVALVLVPLAAALACVRPVNDPDLWWHLRGAEQVIAAGRWWIDEQGSFLQAGTWWNTEWVGQLAALGVWRAAGAAGITAAVAGAAGLTAWLCLRAAPVGAWPLVAGAQLAFADHWAPRPQSAMMVGVALALGVGAPGPWWAWVAAQVVWSHVHASHVLLPLVPAAAALDARLRGDARWRDWAVRAAACAAASLLLNPLGPGVVAEVLDHAGSDSARHIGDMRPPALADVWPAAWGPQAVALLVGAFVAARAPSVDWRAPGAVRAGLLALLGLALAASAVRFRAVGVLLVLPLAVRVWGEGFRGDGGRVAALAAAALALLPVAWASGTPAWGRVGVQVERVAEDAARFLAGREGGRLWNHYDDGGYLAWRLPAWQIAIDGRTPTWFTEHVHALWRQSARSGATFRTMAAVYDLDAALVPRSAPLCAALRADAAWQAAFADPTRVLFVRAEPGGAPGFDVLARCDGEPAPTCDEAAAVHAEAARLDAAVPGALLADVAVLRLGACGDDPRQIGRAHV